jgi:hypothetical protein
MVSHHQDHARSCRCAVAVPGRVHVLLQKPRGFPRGAGARYKCSFHEILKHCMPERQGLPLCAFCASHAPKRRPGYPVWSNKSACSAGTGIEPRLSLPRIARATAGTCLMLSRLRGVACVCQARRSQGSLSGARQTARADKRGAGAEQDRLDP